MRALLSGTGRRPARSSEGGERGGRPMQRKAATPSPLLVRGWLAAWVGTSRKGRRDTCSPRSARRAGRAGQERAALEAGVLAGEVAVAAVELQVLLVQRRCGARGPRSA